MTGAVLVAPRPAMTLVFRRQMRDDRALRERSRQKRHEILEQIEHHPDADPGLRRQAEFYRERLEAGMERDDDQR